MTYPISALEIRRTFNFEALPKAAQNAAIEAERENVYNDSSDFWDDEILTAWHEKLAAVGFEHPEIAYSGFCSQGDGASFTCESIDVPKLIQVLRLVSGDTTAYAKLLELVDAGFEVLGCVERINRRYVHQNSVRSSLETTFSNYEGAGFEEEAIMALIRELEKDIDESMLYISHDVYKELEEAYTWWGSDERIREELEYREDDMYYASGAVAAGSTL